MLADEFPKYGPDDHSSVTIHLYVTDADASFAPFWGDRHGQVIDPFGHHWSIAEHVEDLTMDQMQERMMAWAGAGDSAQ